MTTLKDLLQEADWKKEKHVPVIEVEGAAKKGAWITVTASIGKEIAHPNTTEHHIRWIALYFLPQGGKFPYEITRTEFNTHGESTEGPNTGTVFTHHEMTVKFKTEKPGTLMASSYCNIHGLWQNAKEITVS